MDASAGGVDPTPMLTVCAPLPPEAGTVVSFPIAVAALALAAIVLFLHWRRERIVREALGPLPPQPH